MQPPSGGCVLKLYERDIYRLLVEAAAFGRLCVETRNSSFVSRSAPAAAFGRLCVETVVKMIFANLLIRQPPSGGCVLKQDVIAGFNTSEKAAAFGRLCVETRG